MARSDLRLFAALVAGISIGAVAASCGSKGGCKTNADCPSNATCTAGACVLKVTHNTSTSGASGATSTSTSTGTSSGGVSGASSGAVTTTIGGSTAAASSGAGGSTGTSGNGCSCTASCCSQVAGNGLVCLDGKACFGTEPDSGLDWYCDYESGKCHVGDPCNGNSGQWVCPGMTNGSTGATGASGSSSGGSTSGAPTIDPTGISFAVVGDTRPDSAGQAYPSQVIQQIYTDIQNLPQPPMAVVATGDFQESSDSSTDTASCISAYEAAAKLFTAGPTYPTMGNHECVGASLTTYCAVGGYTTANFTGFLQMLTDLNLPNTTGQPYYVETLTAPNGDTAKFVMTAAQAWDSTQKSWLDTTLSTPSTFTFVARHEPDDAVGCSNSTPNDNTTNSCPFIADVQSVINAHPGGVTLKLEGHTHDIRFDHYNDALVSGAGGATLQSPCNTSNTIYCNYGYVLCQERTDKKILCTVYDINSGAQSMPAPSVASNTADAGTFGYAN